MQYLYFRDVSQVYKSQPCMETEFEKHLQMCIVLPEYHQVKPTIKWGHLTHDPTHLHKH